MSATTTEFAAQFLSTLKTADESYLADVLMALDRGLPIFKARKDAEKTAATEVEEPVKEKEKAVKAKAVKKKVDVELPAADNGAPDASEYRIDQDNIDTSKCIGRQVMDMDKRWSTAIIRERQCGKEITEDGLCKGCAGRAETYEEKAGPWLGRVTEEPFEWCHMLGTAWAVKKKLVFNPSASATVSENGSDQEEMQAEKKKPGRAPKMTEEEKAAEKAKKEAEKEAKKAEKEAEKAAEKAKKEAEKEAKKAEKAAEKAEKAPKAKKETKKETKKEVKKAEAKVVSTEEPVEVLSNLRYINDVLYWVRDGNVYNYTELTEEVGSFVGRLTDQDTIDTEADEVAAESDAE